MSLSPVEEALVDVGVESPLERAARELGIADEIGTRYDGWARYRCRVETRVNRRGVRQWRYVIERTFVRTDQWWKIGWWSANPKRVLRRALKQMPGRPSEISDDAGYL